ncbi:MAG: PAS domain-containing methyl-accepting chemotaxis protein [Deltaproteobacteria bacterium]|nr:PAS domain-containing methyl-accepting chemotaxis protein [Deltaproteobacteria bacterium]
MKTEATRARPPKAQAGSGRERRALDEKIRRLETYCRNVDQQVLLLGNELAYSNCIKLGIVEPFFTTDTALLVTHANEGFGAVCGKPSAQIKQRPLAEAVRFAEPEVAQAFTTCLATARPVGLKATLVRADGNARFALRIGPLRKTTREVVGLYCMLQEITGVEDAATQLASVTPQLLATASQQNASLSEQSAAVTETMTTVKEISHAAQQSAEQAQTVIDLADRAEAISREGVDTVDQSVKAIDAIRERVAGIADSVLKLSDQASTIGEIATTVNELADQINMLALNASIEAAKAGDSGRGFAVVAVEMRRLAEHSKRSTQQIRTVLGEVQKVIRTVVRATEEGSAQVEQGVRLASAAGQHIGKLNQSIGDSSQAAKEIAVATRQQSIGIDQVCGAMSNITQASTDSVAGIKQLEAVARDLQELCDRLTEMLKRL